jgi:hypothetical protein
MDLHLFRFFMNKVGWLVMQYKVFPTDALWSLKGGMAIWLWKEDGTRQPKLLAGVSNPIPFCPIWWSNELKGSEKERFISNKILKHIEFWKLEMSKDDSYSRVMGPYVKYWENILELLSRPIPR